MSGYIVGTSGHTETLQGTVEIRTEFEGSKSEKSTAVLVTEEGDVLIYIQGDNPYELVFARKFDAMSVEMRGTWRRQTFVVDFVSPVATSEGDDDESM